MKTVVQGHGVDVPSKLLENGPIWTKMTCISGIVGGRAGAVSICSGAEGNATSDVQDVPEVRMVDQKVRCNPRQVREASYDVGTYVSTTRCVVY